MSHADTPLPRPAYASPADGVAALAALAFAIVLPLALGFSGPLQNVILTVAIYAILAQGLNVVVGFTGLLDLGYVIFMATGAMLAAFLLSVKRTPAGLDWRIGKTEFVPGEPLLGFDGSILLVIVAAGVVCAVLGLLRGIPTLRVTGDYFAIVTLGVAEIAFETGLWADDDVLNMTRVTGGAFGVKLETETRPVLFGRTLYYDEPVFYYLVIACVVLTFLAVHHLNRSRLGRALAAIRLDETAARACGVDVGRHKLLAFTFSGFLGGVGGALYAVWQGTISVKGFDVWKSVLVLACVVLGGMGSVRGVAVGTLIVMSLDEALRIEVAGVSVPPEARYLVYGLLLILFMRFRPQGIFPPVRRGRPVSREEQGALLRDAAPLYALGAARGPGDALEGDEVLR